MVCKKGLNRYKYCDLIACQRDKRNIFVPIEEEKISWDVETYDEWMSGKVPLRLCAD